MNPLELLKNNNYVGFKDYIERNPETINLIDPEDSCGWSLLHCACFLGRIEFVDLLLKHGVNFNQYDLMGWSPLHVATWANQLTIVKLLINKGANINSLTYYDETILYLSAEKGYEELIHFILTRSNVGLLNKTRYGLTAIEIAIRRDKLNCVKILMSKQLLTLSVVQQQRFILLALQHDAFLTINYLLLECGFNLESWAEETASYLSTHDMQDYISVYGQLERLASYNIILPQLNQHSNNWKLKFAILELIIYFHQSQIRIFEHFIRNVIQSIEPNTEISTVFVNSLLHIKSNNLDSLRFLLDHFNGINYCDLDGKGKTLFLFAIEKDNLTLAQETIRRYGREIIAQTDIKKNGLIHYACRFNSEQCINYFLNNLNSFRIDIDAPNEAGETALHIAAANNHADLLENLLVCYQAIPDIQDKEGNTPLHTAVNCSALASVKSLVSVFNQHLSIKNGKGYTALALATQDPELDNYLIQYLTPQTIRHEPNALINTLVFQGGGVKGSAFYGALKKLVSKCYVDLSKIRRVAGTSAGAISALLLAVGYSLDEVNNILISINFEELLEETHRHTFLELKEQYTKNGLQGLLGQELYQFFIGLKQSNDPKEGVLKLIDFVIRGRLSNAGIIIQTLMNEFNLRNIELEKASNQLESFISRVKPLLEKINKDKGLFKGEILKQKFEEWIEAKTGNRNLTFVELKDLAISCNYERFKELYVFAYEVDSCHEVCFSAEDKDMPGTPVALALRCSMSIQGLFEPAKVEGKSYFDGGSTCNYPLSYFDKERFIDNISYMGTLFTQPSRPDNKKTNPHALGFRLVNPELYAHYEEDAPLSQRKENDSLLSFLMDVFISISTFTTQESNYQFNPDEKERTVHINTYDIETADFDLSALDIKRLVQSGESAADRFLLKQTLIGETRNNNVQVNWHDYSHIFSEEQTGKLQTQMNKVYNFLSETTNIEQIKSIVKRLRFPICNRDLNGDNLCHRAIKDKKLDILERLFKIAPKLLSMKNYSGYFPLDYVIFCDDAEKRKNIIQFFLERNLLNAKLLFNHPGTLNEQKRFILRKAEEFQSSKQSECNTNTAPSFN